MKPRIKTFLLSLTALALIFGSLFIFRKPEGAASYSYYEQLRISASSLNGNSVWGGGESFDTVVSMGGLDAWAAFYSATQKSSGGLEPSGALSINGVPYQMSWTGAGDYNGNDTIRLYSDHISTTVTLDTIGAYEKLYVLGTAGGPGAGNYADFSVRVNYTDGTSDETNYRLYDWYDATPVAGVYKWPNLGRRLVVKSGSTNTGWRPGQPASQTVTSDYSYEGATDDSPYLQSADITVDPKKLVRSIDLVLNGKNGSGDVSGIYCGIYAITGMVNVSAPNPVEIIYVDNVSYATADIFWDYVENATNYRLDIALDPDFQYILPDYNNREVSEIRLTAEGLSENTTYYTRVRAENSAGQSISSNVVSFHTLETVIPEEPKEDIKPVIDVDTNGYIKGSWTNSPVTLTVVSLSDEEGTTSYYYSEDNIEWKEYSESVVHSEDTLEVGQDYYFKAISEAGLESDVVSINVKKDSVVPTISETDPEKTYYSELELEVADNMRLESVTINGEETPVSDGKITIPGNTNAELEIVATDAAGNSTSSVIKTGELEISVSGETERWIPFDVATITATDLEGAGRIEVSKDSGENWMEISTEAVSTMEILENDSYIFRITEPGGSSASTSIVYHNIDPIKPVVEVDSHGYELGTWTNIPVTLTARNVANNLSPVSLFVREKGTEEWLDYKTVIVSDDTDSRVFEYKAVSAAGLESDIVEAEVKKDSVAPTGEIKTGENAWNNFLSRITFGLFFNETKKFEVEATDDRSGIAKLEYLLSESELSSEELRESFNWTEAESVSVKPEKDFAIYYRLTDNAGNISIINTEGIVLDVTPPVVKGFANGETYDLEADKIYYLTQKLVISDNKALEEIRINGETVIPKNNLVEIPGNVDAEVLISVIDKAGNETNVVVKTGKINIIDDLEHKTIDDVENLDEEIEKLKDLLEENPTDEEKELIENLINDYEETEEEIDDTEEKVKVIEETNELIPEIDHVNFDDKERIEDLIDAIERTEEENGSHLTDEEKEELDRILDELKEKLERIEDVEEEIKDIDERMEEFDEGSVSKDDLGELEEIREEIEELLDGDNLTDEEREHLEELLDKIDELEERIEEAEKALEEAKENDKATEITPENVRPEDQTTLEDASSGYAEALGVFDGNFSLADLFDINNRISIINSALDILDQVAEFEAMISRLPNPDQIDYNSRTSIKAAQIAYNELSEYGKSLVGPSLMAKYRAILEAYRAFLEGSPLLYAFETLDVFWWALSTFFITGVFITIVRKTHRRYAEDEDDKF
ncbi:hypothetical protein IJ380_00960 [Candidatus Saccharibacteria bacterium]|nr:hypothetical protein [Candidatus Saccharibacteria bacterium]